MIGALHNVTHLIYICHMVKLYLKCHVYVLSSSIWEMTGPRHLGGDDWEEMTGPRHLGDDWDGK